MIVIRIISFYIYEFGILKLYFMEREWTSDDRGFSGGHRGGFRDTVGGGGTY